MVKGGFSVWAMLPTSQRKAVSLHIQVLWLAPNTSYVPGTSAHPISSSLFPYPQR